jgi:hypothetical protein
LFVIGQTIFAVRGRGEIRGASRVEGNLSDALARRWRRVFSAEGDTGEAWMREILEVYEAERLGEAKLDEYGEAGFLETEK